MSTQSSTLNADAVAQPRCYHCGLAVPPRVHYTVLIHGLARDMCCAGCEAVAGAIVDAGFDHYYDRRDRYPDSPREALPEVVSNLEVFDRPEIQANFVSAPSEREREASLILEGITCPACIWLNERHLARQTGVLAVQINYTTRRARVRWDIHATTLSAILQAIRAIGYRAYPYDPRSLEAMQKNESRNLLTRLAVAGLGMMQVMMYALPAYLASDGSITADVAALMRWASLMLTLPVVFYSSAPFFASAWRDLAARRIGMDVPVALAIGVAFAASTWATLAGHGEVYFDSIAMFVFLLLGARYIELRARQKAAAHLESLSRAVPATAAKLLNFPLCLNFETVSADALEVDDYILVRPGESFAADGLIEQGETESDESLLSGESKPVRKIEGDRVIGGAINCGNPVIVRTDRVGEQTTLSAIVRLMERAAHTRPRLQQITDQVASYFVAGVLAVTVLAALGWWIQDPVRAFPIAISILIVTCPCALALATPMALAVATARAARHGLLVTRGHALETLARATHFVLDKTGTLTVGRPTLVEVRVLRGSRDEALRLAAALEQGSEHPLAHAILETVPIRPVASQVRNVPGYGIEAWVDGRRLRIGTPMFVAEIAADRDTFGGDGNLWLGDEQGAIAVLRFADTLRSDAAAFVRTLRMQGVHVSLMSGDHSPAVREVAQALGIDDWHAGQSPEAKREKIMALQAKGAVIAMIGDGVNDAPVLAQAQVSVAMMSGAALAQGAADMVLLSGRLTDLSNGVAYARRTLAVVRQNLGWAIGYNLLAIPLAVAGLVTPWVAAIGMSASSMLVVLNAMRLTREKRKYSIMLVQD